MAFMVRSAGSSDALVPALRSAMRRLDPDVALERLATLDDVRRQALAPVRFLTGLLAVFGAVALALAAAGVYGLMSCSVASRTREIGIRLAVGASRRDVHRLVLREGGIVTLAGILLGSLGALALARALRSMLLGVGWLDGAAWGGVLGTLAAVALLATLVPAFRATRVDPVRTLRGD
jgi:ABC-type antimicrobial peptide transport system permease subunit